MSIFIKKYYENDNEWFDKWKKNLVVKNPEMKGASFSDLMDLNLALQNLLPPPRTAEPDSPANRAAIKAMIDTDKNRSLD